MLHADWSPLLWTPEPPADERLRPHIDLRHAHNGRFRNGFPEVRPYRWRPGEAERDAEVAARIAAARAAAAAALRAVT